MSTVSPRSYKGVRDLLPARARARARLIQQGCRVAEQFGYVPLATSCLELQEVLVGEWGEDTTKEIFRWQDADGQEIGLRFDLTVGLARVVAATRDLPRPFRAYQVGRSWRFDKPDPGRFREFIQLDVDSVGCPTVAADVETVSAVVAMLEAMGAPAVQVRVSHRKALEALVARAGIPQERTPDVLRVLDKLDKVGLEAVLEELGPGRVDASGDPIRGAGLTAAAIQVVGEYLQLARGEGRNQVLGAMGPFLGDAPGARQALADLEEMDSLLTLAGLGPDRVILDLSIARGLAYYTGPVYETVLRDAPRFGSVSSGGRYDDLVARFGKDRIPATGGSIGVDRLLDALEALDLLQDPAASAQVLVTVMDAEGQAASVQMARELREAGIPTELYVGDAARLGKQLRYADRTGIPVVVIAGPDERAAGRVTIKEMGEGRERSGEVENREEWSAARFGQRTVPREQLLSAIREALSLSRRRSP